MLFVHVRSVCAFLSPSGLRCLVSCVGIPSVALPLRSGGWSSGLSPLPCLRRSGTCVLACAPTVSFSAHSSLCSQSRLQCAGKPLTTTLIVDIMNLIGKCVVSGTSPHIFPPALPPCIYLRSAAATLSARPLAAFRWLLAVAQSLL